MNIQTYKLSLPSHHHYTTKGILKSSLFTGVTSILILFSTTRLMIKFTIETHKQWPLGVENKTKIEVPTLNKDDLRIPFVVRCHRLKQLKLRLIILQKLSNILHPSRQNWTTEVCFFLQKENNSWKYLSQFLLTSYFILVCLNEKNGLLLI